jgi:hypothetical protein
VYEPQIFNKADCTDCISNIWENIKDLGGSLKDIVKFVVEEKADQQEWERRKQICMSCQYKNSNGERLIRSIQGGYYSCGLFRLREILRDSKAEGCGCILNIKWAGKNQKCPNSLW